MVIVVSFEPTPMYVPRQVSGAKATSGYRFIESDLHGVDNTVSSRHF